jgi:predicted secreted protein
MNFSDIKQHKIAISLALDFVVCTVSVCFFITYLQPEVLQKPSQQDLQPTPIHPASPVNQTGPGPGESPVSRCDPLFTDSQSPVPADISVAIRDPVPGIRYSLGENDSGRTIILGKGDIVEINLRWIPGLGFHWVIPVSGCGLELVNAGTFSDGGDFWNNTGHYRVRYRAVSPGTSIIDGKFILVHEEKGDPGFNLTVIVK